MKNILEEDQEEEELVLALEDAIRNFFPDEELEEILEDSKVSKALDKLILVCKNKKYIEYNKDEDKDTNDALDSDTLYTDMDEFEDEDSGEETQEED